MQNDFKYLDELIHSGVKKVDLRSDIVLEPQSLFDYENGIKLDIDNFVLDGRGHTIDAKGLTRIFCSTGNNVTIKNLTLKNGYAKKYGGAIYHDEGRLSILDSKFIENGAEYGGAILNRDDLIIKNSLFSNNVVNMDGGAILNRSGDMSITNSRFMKNVSGYNGGAIDSVYSSLIIGDCLFEENVSKNEGGAMKARGIVRSREDKFLKISASKFIKNTAEKNGGALRVALSKNILLGCTFTDNKPNDVEEGY